jgi:hypothetical protein
MFFRILMAIALATGAITLFFFLWAIADGSLYDGGPIFLTMIAVIAGVAGLATFLRRQGYPRLGTAVLFVVAWPAFGYALFLTLAISTPNFWR